MKIIVLLFVFIFSSYAANNDTIKIIEKYSKIKGLDEVQNLKDFKISGVNGNGKFAMQFNYFFLKPNFHRLDVKGEQLDLKLIWNGKDGAVKSGNFPPQELNGRDKVIFTILSELIFSPIYEYQKHGFTFSNEGIVDTNGTKSYRILKTDKAGVISDLLIDTSNFNLVEFVKLFDEFKEPYFTFVNYDKYTDFKGIKIPKEVNLKINDQDMYYKVDSVMFNIGLVPYDFRKPF